MSTMYGSDESPDQIVPGCTSKTMEARLFFSEEGATIPITWAFPSPARYGAGREGKHLECIWFRLTH